MMHKFKDYTWLHFPKLSSTNHYAKILPLELCDKKMIITVDEQTAGYGRFNKVWQSAKQNIACSILLLDPKESGNELSNVLALSIVKALRDVDIQHVQLKWPNDVLVSGKKVAGILIEQVFMSQHVKTIIGFGINIGKQSFEKEIKQKAGYLEVDKSELLFKIFRNFESMRTQFSKIHITQLFMCEVHWMIGQKISNNNKIYTIKELTDEGAILLEDDDQNVIKHIAGEITLSTIYQMI